MHGGTADTRQRLAGCEPGQKLRTTVRAPVMTRPADTWSIANFRAARPDTLEVADFTCVRMVLGSSAPGS